MRDAFLLVLYLMVGGGVAYSIHLFAIIIGDNGAVGVVSYMGDIGDNLIDVFVSYILETKETICFYFCLLCFLNNKQTYVRLDVPRGTLTSWWRVGGGARGGTRPQGCVNCSSKFFNKKTPFLFTKLDNYVIFNSRRRTMIEDVDIFEDDDDELDV